MKLTSALTLLLVTHALSATLVVGAQHPAQQLTAKVVSNPNTASHNTSVSKILRRSRRPKPPITRQVIPPVTVLNNPEYLSGEASISVAANSNPLIRIGIAQNGVTLIEFPSADKFFAIHAGNTDLVTVEKSPSLKRDHHLVLRAGSGFLVPNARARGTQLVPATSIIAQMDSGMAITVMIYPVPLLKQQAHRLVIKYDRDQVITSRRAVGLATNLVGTEPPPETDLRPSPTKEPAAASTGASGPTVNEISDTAPPAQRQKPDYKSPVETALSEAMSNPKQFQRWSDPRHGLKISTMPPHELSESVSLLVFAVRNTGSQSLRLVFGYPDLYVETLNEQKRPVETGDKIEKVYLASSSSDNLIPAGVTRYFALAYEAPILGAQQHLKIVVAHMSAADEPAMADVTALAR
jgi:hypothetical protein